MMTKIDMEQLLIRFYKEIDRICFVDCDNCRYIVLDRLLPEMSQPNIFIVK